MAVRNILSKAFGNFKGLDLRSSELVTDPFFATEIQNASYNKAGAITKRNGQQIKAPTKGGLGLGIYSNINTITGVNTQELLAVDDKLHKLSTYTLSLTYSGSDIALFSITYDTTLNTFSATIVEDQATVLSFSLGTGKEEASPITISDLVTAINAVANFTATASGATTTPAAYIDLVQDIQLSATASIINYYNWTTVNSPIASPFAQASTNKNEELFTNASIVNLQNIAYIGTGYDELMKYDGQNVYRAGLPQGTTATTAAAGAGSITNADTRYIVVPTQYDAKGNLIEGIASIESATLALAAQNATVTLTNILASSGFNTACAIVNGAQAAVTTINVDNGSGGAHTLLVGDTAYFYDAVSASYVEREITARTASTITISGAAVTVSDNAAISNNLRLGLYRNIASGTTFYLVEELPNNSFTATQVYTDSVTDANLQFEYIVPIKEHGLPPKGRFLTVFRNQLFIADVFNTVYYSDIDSAEYFPAGDNSFNVYTNRGDTITGLSSLPNALFIFKDKSLHIASGDFAEDAFRLDQVNKGDIGCIAHHTIQEVNGSLFFLSKKGVFAINESATLQEVSLFVEPEFTRTGTTYNLRKSVALNWLNDDKYVILLPTEIESNSVNNHLDEDESLVLVFDYIKNAWLSWTNINCLGGLVLYNDIPYFTERRNSATAGTTVYTLSRFNNYGNAFDYLDHASAIEMIYKTSWDSLNEPSRFKKFLRLKVFTLPNDSYEIEPPLFNLDVDIELNFVPNVVASFSLDFAGDALGWGDNAWGDDSWGSTSEIELKHKLIANKSRSLRMTFKNSEPMEGVLISGYETEIAVPYEAFIKE
jgi:hypothetical protein